MHTIARAVGATESLLIRFMAGFDDQNRTTLCPGLPNHPIWILGHCALTMHRLAEMIDGEEIPSNDFVYGDGFKGGPDRFDAESVGKDSIPADDHRMYPTLERGIEVYSAACNRLSAAVASADSEKMMDTIQWHGSSVPLIDLVFRVCFHNGCHGGAIDRFASCSESGSGHLTGDFSMACLLGQRTHTRSLFLIP